MWHAGRSSGSSSRIHNATRHARAAAQPPALPPAQPQQRGNTRSQQPRGSHSGGVEAAAHDADATVDLSASDACIFRAHECINICEINDCGDKDVLLSNPQPPPRTRRTDGVLCLTLRARGSMSRERGLAAKARGWRMHDALGVPDKLVRGGGGVGGRVTGRGYAPACAGLEAQDSYELRVTKTNSNRPSQK